MILLCQKTIHFFIAWIVSFSVLSSTYAFDAELHNPNVLYPPTNTGYFPDGPFISPTVTYEIIDGLAIFEGDIILGLADDPGLEQSVAITGRDVRWRNGVIPYTIDSSLSVTMISRINIAIAHWESTTRIDLVLRNANNANQFPDFVTFRSGLGCSSHVGRQGGQQFINLSGGCSIGNTIHEIGHTVGLWHEQSREDRNNFVRINFSEIIPNRRSNFVQHIADGVDIGEYDFGSIMHYPLDAFSCSGCNNTITPLVTVPAGVTVGQRTGLSVGDIAGVNFLYPPLVSLATINGNFVVSENGGGGVVNANRNFARNWETFGIIDINAGLLMSGDPVHFRAYNGQHYLVAEGGGGREVLANRTQALGWETFIIRKTSGDGIINFGDQISLQAANGLYVVAEGGGGSVVNANRSQVFNWETFRLYPSPILVHLRADNGEYLVAEGGGGDIVNADRSQAQNWETFTLIDINGGLLVSGDSVNFRTYNGKHYLVAEGGGGREVLANRTQALGWETFIIRKTSGDGIINFGDQISLQAANGLYVVAEGGGGSVVNANRSQVFNWETFTIETPGF